MREVKIELWGTVFKGLYTMEFSTESTRCRLVSCRSPATLGRKSSESTGRRLALLARSGSHCIGSTRREDICTKESEIRIVRANQNCQRREEISTSNQSQAGSKCSGSVSAVTNTGTVTLSQSECSVVFRCPGTGNISGKSPPPEI